MALLYYLSIYPFSLSFIIITQRSYYILYGLRMVWSKVRRHQPSSISTICFHPMMRSRSSFSLNIYFFFPCFYRMLYSVHAVSLSLISLMSKKELKLFFLSFYSLAKRKREEKKCVCVCGCKKLFSRERRKRIERENAGQQ